MNILQMLPECVLLHIIEQWIANWKDFAHLDSAICNKNSRGLFLSMIHNKILGMKNLPLKNSTLLYIQKRNIGYKSLTIQACFQNHVPVETVWHNLEHLHVCLNKSYSVECLYEMLYKCEKLKDLEVRRVGSALHHVSPLYYEENFQFKSLASLQTLAIANAEGIHDSDLSFLASMSPNLVELNLSNCSSITGHGLIAALKLWPQIQRLTTTRIEPLDYLPSILESIDQDDHYWHGNLKSLVMFDVFIQESFLHYLFKHNAHIQHLRLPHCRVNSALLSMITSTYPQLVSLEVKCGYFLEVADLWKLLHSCPRLQTVHLCNAVQNRMILPNPYDLDAWNLVFSRCSSLQDVNFGNILPLTDGLLLLLSQNCYLHSLHIQTTWKVTNEGLREFLWHQILKENSQNVATIQPKKKRLGLREVPKVSEGMIQIMKNCHWEVLA
jgi:hypothetical protein